MIVHVLNGMRFGGNESLCLQLIRHAPSHVRSVLINANPSQTEMAHVFNEVSGLSTRTVAYDPCDRLGFTLRLATVLQELAPDALMTYPFGLHTLTSVSAHIAGTPKIAVHAGNPPPDSGSERRLLWRSLVGASTALSCPILFCSHSVEHGFRQLGLPLPPGSRTIPIGCDVVGIRARAQAVRRKNARPVIGMVARLNRIKDHATLVRAIAVLKARDVDCELRLVGEGEQRPMLERLVASSGVEDRVQFLGERADIAEQLGGFDLFVFSTTVEEGFGIAMIEAMASGIPVVAADVPACREVLGDAAPFFKAGDAEALAALAQRLLGAPGERDDISARLQARALERYDAPVCAKSHYDYLLGST